MWRCPQLCMVSLSLFRTLLSLNCEDVMLQLVLRYSLSHHHTHGLSMCPPPCLLPPHMCALMCVPRRYLLPCSHLMLSQKRAVRDLDIYGRTAAKFLSLIPQCCQPQSPPLPHRDQEPAAWSRGTEPVSVCPLVTPIPFLCSLGCQVTPCPRSVSLGLPGQPLFPC